MLLPATVAQKQLEKKISSHEQVMHKNPTAIDVDVKAVIRARGSNSVRTQGSSDAGGKQITPGCELLIQLLHPTIVCTKLPKDSGVTGQNQLSWQTGCYPTLPQRNSTISCNTNPVKHNMTIFTLSSSHLRQPARHCAKGLLAE